MGGGYVRGAEGTERRGAEGAEFEVPKAPRSEAPRGGGFPLPSRLGGLGERRELPQRGPGGAPAANALL